MKVPAGAAFPKTHLDTYSEILRYVVQPIKQSDDDFLPAGEHRSASPPPAAAIVEAVRVAITRQSKPSFLPFAAFTILFLLVAFVSLQRTQLSATERIAYASAASVIA